MLVLAASRDQAHVVFDYIRGFLEASPVLRQEIDVITASEIRLKSGVVIAIHANSFRSIRGRTLLACIFDEVSMWRDESSATPDLEVYRAVLPALMTTEGHAGRHLDAVSQGRSAPSEAPRPLRRRPRRRAGCSGSEHAIQSDADAIRDRCRRRRRP